MAEIRIIENIKVVKNVFVSPCIKCGSDNVVIGDCGYSSFNMAYANCKCGNKISYQCDTNPSIESIADKWNEVNDIPTIIEAKQKQIRELNTEIEELNIRLNKGS